MVAFEQSKVKNDFPAMEITGCFYHFMQCLWRNSKKRALVCEYKGDERVRLYIRTSTALAHNAQKQLEVQAEISTRAKFEHIYD